MSAAIRVLAVIASLAGCSLAIGFEEPQDLRLSQLEISDGVLMPAFSPEITMYSVALPPAFQAVIRAEASSESAQVTVAGQLTTGTETMIDVHPGRQTISVVVESTTGIRITYTIAATIAGADFERLLQTFGSEATAVASGDFDRDGKRDLALITENPIQVVRGNGQGGHESIPNATPEFIANPTDLAVADLDHDAIDDLVVVGTDGVSIFLGRGDGTFDPPILETTTAGSDAVAIGELTGDAHLDLAVTSVTNDSIRILVGTGDGTFTPGIVLGPPGPKSPVITDVVGSAANDIIVTTANNNFTVHENLGNGAAFGTFGRGVDGGADALAIGHFNGDQLIDFAVTIESRNEVVIVTDLFGDPSGNGTDQRFDAGGPPRTIVAADVDGDQRADILAPTQQNLTVLFATASGFAPLAYPVVGEGPLDILVDDFNGDALPDLVSVNGSPDVSILLNRTQ